MEEQIKNITDTLLLTLLNKYFTCKNKNHFIDGYSVQILEDVKEIADRENQFQFDSIYKVNLEEKHDALKLTLGISNKVAMDDENIEVVTEYYSFILNLNTIDDLFVDGTDFEMFVDKIADLIEGKYKSN